MNARDEAALALYQANRSNPEIEALIDQFFSFPTRDEYEEELLSVTAAMSSEPGLRPAGELDFANLEF